jgi:hypothetical protein
MQLMDLNNVIYGQSIDLSAGIDRKLIERYPEKTDYIDKEELVFTLNNTRQFVDMSNSSLSFNFTIVGGDQVKLLSEQSALNLIKRVIVSAPDGTKLSHCDKVNLLQQNLLRVKHDDLFGLSSASSFLYNITGNDSDFVAGQAYFVSIPLRLLSPVFDNKKLMPPQLVDKLRIEIEFEKPEIAFKSNTVPDRVLINNPVLVLDSYQMIPAILNKTLEMKELIYEYCDWNNLVASVSEAGNSFNIAYDRSVSNALEAFAVLRPVGFFVKNQNSFSQDSISNAVEDNNEDSLVWRWGSLQLPHTRLFGASRLYQNVLYVYDQLSNKQNNMFSMSLTAFKGDQAIYPVNLRRSKLFEYSGREISNRNNLMCEIGTSSAALLQADLFIKSLSRVIIKGDTFTVEE